MLQQLSFFPGQMQTELCIVGRLLVPPGLELPLVSFEMPWLSEKLSFQLKAADGGEEKERDGASLFAVALERRTRTRGCK